MWIVFIIIGFILFCVLLSIFFNKEKNNDTRKDDFGSKKRSQTEKAERKEGLSWSEQLQQREAERNKREQEAFGKRGENVVSQMLREIKDIHGGYVFDNFISLGFVYLCVFSDKEEFHIGVSVYFLLELEVLRPSSQG